MELLIKEKWEGNYVVDFIDVPKSIVSFDFKNERTMYPRPHVYQMSLKLNHIDDKDIIDALKNIGVRISDVNEKYGESVYMNGSISFEDVPERRKRPARVDFLYDEETGRSVGENEFVSEYQNVESMDLRFGVVRNDKGTMSLYLNEVTAWMEKSIFSDRKKGINFIN